MKKFFLKIISTVLIVAFVAICIPLGTISVEATQTMSKNFNKDYVLTGDYRDDIVAVAEAQYQRSEASLGYTEAWCADFVCDCGKLAGIPNFPYYGGCDGLITRLKTWGGEWYTYDSKYIPQKGDIVFFSKYSNTSTDSTHVGIVYSDGFNSDGSINTIEGNTSLNGVGGYVNIKKRTISSSSISSLYILGYISLNIVPPSSNPDDYPVCERDLVYNSTVETGNDVKWVQCVLKHLGYSIDIDGSYGPSSRDVIKKFQSAYGLTVDGQCGPKTRAKLKEVWASKGHTWDSGTVVTAATHTSTGVKKHKCNYCEATKNETIAKLSGHTYGAWQNHNSSQHKKSCACGDVQYANHTWNSGTVTTQPTCTATGVRTYTCTGCNATKTEPISAKGHSYSSWQNYSSSQHKKTCSCSDVQYANHTWNSGTITKAATHTEEGIKTYTCTGCNATKTEAIAKLSGHTYGDWVNYDELQHKRVCACGFYELSNHNWDNGVITTPASTTQDGVKTFDCINCNASKTEKIPMLEAPENYPLITVSDYEAVAGGTVTVTVALKNNPGIASLILKVAYDHTLLTLTNVQYNTELGGQTIAPVDFNSPVTLYWINAFADMSDDTVFATLTFKVNDDAVAGNSSDIVISYNANDVYNINEENIEFTIQNGTITVSDYLPGDINGDGALNNKDVTRLMQYFADWDVAVNEAAIDVNGDGTFNNKDVSRLMQYLASWNVEIY